MSDKTPEVKITLQPDGVVAPILNALKECSQTVLLGHKAVENLSTMPETNLENEIFFKLEFPYDAFDEQKKKYKEWLITRGFQDLVEGMKLSLIEAYRYLSVFEWFGGTSQQKKTTVEEVNKYFDELRKDSAKQQLPGLLDKVRPLGQLQYEKHILSLNRARRCLVHRNGIVTPEDVNTPENTLKIIWIRYFLFYESDDGEEELVKNHRMKKSAAVMLKIKQEEKAFQLGEKITFTYKEFYEFMTTFHHFAIDIGSKLPKIK
jgi:hypothetical protein